MRQSITPETVAAFIRRQADSTQTKVRATVYARATRKGGKPNGTRG